MVLRDLLRVLGSADRRGGRNLTREESYEAFAAILDGGESDVAIGAFLVALRWKGVRVDELCGFARAARDRARIPCADVEGLVCICPPHDGHEQIPPLEVAAGLTAAAAGVRVLLVSDRGVPPKRGVTAIDVLQAAGAGATWDAAEAEDWVARARFAAIAASGMLPALLPLRRVRGEIGVRTPLATVEKLLAPESAAVVLGAQHGPVLGTAVETMAGLGHPRGIALQGRDGGVVPTVTRRTRGIELTGSHQVPLSVEPDDFGLAGGPDPELPIYGPPQEEKGPGDCPELVAEARRRIEAVLAGETGPARAATLLAAAVVLKAGGRAATIAEGIDAATNALDSGAARELLERLKEFA